MAIEGYNQDSFFAESEGQARGRVECLELTFENDEDRREYFLDKLREKLKDPEFRKIEGFPLGSDEDILRLSDPPYYTACPNPFMEHFIRCYGKPFDPEEPYNPEPFAADVSEGKSDPICAAHTYHTKVPYRAIARYILHYTRPGDVVLDSFAGTGMTGLAAQLCAMPDAKLRGAIEREQSVVGGVAPAWGERRVVLFDLSPFACFLARNYNAHLPAAIFEKRARTLLQASEDSLDWVYRTDVPGEDKLATISYALWTESLYCECGMEVPLWNPRGLPDFPMELDTAFPCPYCGAKVSKTMSLRAKETFPDPLLNRVVTQNKQSLSMISYVLRGRMGRKVPSDFDRDLLRKIDSHPFPSYVPTQPMMFRDGNWGEMYRAGYHFGITHAHHFWTRRNLLVLSDMFSRAFSSTTHQEMLFLCTSFAVKTGSRMHNVAFKDGKLNLAGQVYNTLQLTSLWAERNLYELAKGKIRDLRPVFEMKKDLRTVSISTASATQLAGLPRDSVDYAFVDPPFGGNIIYSELSFLYESWLRVWTNQAREAIVAEKAEKRLDTYQTLMLEAFREISRVLNPGRWLTVAFHNSQNAVWTSIQEALGMARFVVADVRILDKGQGTFKQMTTQGAVKQDLVISAYKPDRDLEKRFDLESGTEVGAWDFTRAHLRQLPIFVRSKTGGAEVTVERLPHLLFDRMVAFHVQRGASVPLSAAEFYAGLEQRFPARDGMYFLADQVADYDRKRMQVTEVEQIHLFVTDESSAIQWLRQELRTKPQTFQEIHPQFMKEIAGWERCEKPLELSSMLAQNFLRYDGNGDVPSQIHSYLSSNHKDLRKLSKEDPRLQAEAKDRWYVPDPTKAQDLEKLRERELLKEFEEYRASRERILKVFRLEAVRAGFKHAWQEHDYSTMVRISRKIPENVLHEDQKLLMWYDQALMRSGTEE